MTPDKIKHLRELLALPRKRHAAWTATHADECHQVFDALPELLETSFLYDELRYLYNEQRDELNRYKKALEVAAERLRMVQRKAGYNSEYSVIAGVGLEEIDRILTGDDVE